ncbi:MAG TPA: hypothetical protein VM183_05075 [Burkholderiales bacterium]|nr:hypothetical protein [Burkholderiales bacterium]
MNASTIRAALSATLMPAAVSGCYVLPIGSKDVDKLVRLMEQSQPALNAPPSTPQFSQGMRPPPLAPAPAPAPAAQGATQPRTIASLPARLYPINDVATEIGMVAGTITSLSEGKARLQFNYRGESLIGEATRVSGDDRKGVATAWAPSGAFMTCEYQMSSQAHGAGTCNFSDGARYQVHVGN